jgi:hypothetical protein
MQIEVTGKTFFKKYFPIFISEKFADIQQVIDFYVKRKLVFA